MVYSLWKNEGKQIVRLNTVISTKVKAKSTNDVALPARASKKARSDEISFGDVYVCDVTQDEIMETIFSR